MMKKFLIHFAQTHVDFRLAELESLAQLENVQLQYDVKDHDIESPFMFVRLPSVEDAQKLIRRSILVKEIILPWATEANFEELKRKVGELHELHEPYKTKSFKFIVSGFNRNIELPDQIKIINQFSFLPFQGPVDLKTPQVIFRYMEDWGPKISMMPQTPLRIHFGVKIGDSSRCAVQQYDLKKREYLGTTSMDPELSLIMANQALVKEGSLVLDPFVGTGSIMIACAHFKGFTTGSDIDGRQLRGKTAFTTPHSQKKEGFIPTKTKENKRDVSKIKDNSKKSVHDNIRQYKLESQILDNVVCDIAHHPWRKIELWDAIVCDPPYGIRAGAKKIGKNQNTIPTESAFKANGEPRYPQTIPYGMDEVVIDLMNFAATYLTSGGRLVFWLPTVTEEYSPEDIPTHPSLKLVANSEQNFGKWSRRLITMEKRNLNESFFENGALNLNGEDGYARRLESNHEPAHNKFRQVYFDR